MLFQAEANARMTPAKFFENFRDILNDMGSGSQKIRHHHDMLSSPASKHFKALLDGGFSQLEESSLDGRKSAALHATQSFDNSHDFPVRSFPPAPMGDQQQVRIVDPVSNDLFSHLDELPMAES